MSMEALHKIKKRRNNIEALKDKINKIRRQGVTPSSAFMQGILSELREINQEFECPVYDFKNCKVNMPIKSTKLSHK